MAERVLVGTRKGLFVLNRQLAGLSALWQIEAVHFLGEPVTMVLHDTRDGTWHAALNLGHFGVKMRRSRDGGKTWQETAAPTYPPQPPADAIKQADAKEEKPWALQQVWSLEAGGPEQPGVLWAGTNPGGLFRSDDGGDSWQLQRSLWDRPERLEWFGGGYDSPGIHSICVDPRDSQCITVGISCGGVWQTRDGGASWEIRASGMLADYMPDGRAGDPNIQDPHRLVQSPSNPDVMWVQHHCGMYRSSDHAASWQPLNAQPSSFGFAVAAHPRNADVAWFVPAIKDACRVPVDARFVVTHTRDGGNSFEVQSNGLPVEASYDLIYRHGLAIDASGEHLAMGSTTGNLWLTENGGGLWSSFSTHLPPIYCLCFAE
jgi:photosystem II stability/assembly factor-like uncharacterized protein